MDLLAKSFVDIPEKRRSSALKGEKEESQGLLTFLENGHRGGEHSKGKQRNDDESKKGKRGGKSEWKATTCKER